MPDLSPGDSFFLECVKKTCSAEASLPSYQCACNAEMIFNPVLALVSIIHSPEPVNPKILKKFLRLILPLMSFSDRQTLPEFHAHFLCFLSVFRKIIWKLSMLEIFSYFRVCFLCNMHKISPRNLGEKADFTGAQFFQIAIQRCS